jgi:hypothetical protein
MWHRIAKALSRFYATENETEIVFRETERLITVNFHSAPPQDC